MSISLNRNLLDLSALLRRNKKISSEDLRNISIYIAGDDREERDIIKAYKGDYLVLHEACLYYGMSNDFIGFTEILEESTTIKNPRNRYIKIHNYDKEHFMIKDTKGYFIPTEARCIIDCIRYKDIAFNEEGLLLAINDYFDLDNTKDELYEVADFFKVPRKVVDYWIEKSDIVNYEI